MLRIPLSLQTDSNKISLLLKNQQRRSFMVRYMFDSSITRFHVVKGTLYLVGVQQSEENRWKIVQFVKNPETMTKE